MKNLNIAYMEHLKDAPFASQFKSIKEGVLEISENIPAIVYEVLPSDNDEVSDIFTDTLLVSIIGKESDTIIQDLATEVLKYTLDMNGRDVKDLYIKNVFRPFRTRKDTDSRRSQVQYIHTFEISWIGENL